MPQNPDPSAADVEFENAANAAANAGSSAQRIEELTEGYAPDPNVAAAIAAGQGISISGVGQDDATKAVVAGGPLAAQITDLLELPIVGAGTPTQQSNAQLLQRFDGVAPSGFRDSKFPTPQ